MFLRANKRFKDGKEHRYWSVVENRRLAGGRPVQKTLLCLVGTPKGRLTKLEKDLATKDWQQVKDDVHVKLLPRDELLLAIGAAKEKAGRNASRLVILQKINAISTIWPCKTI